MTFIVTYIFMSHMNYCFDQNMHEITVEMGSIWGCSLGEFGCFGGSLWVLVQRIITFSKRGSVLASISNLRSDNSCDHLRNVTEFDHKNYKS